MSNKTITGIENPNQGQQTITCIVRSASSENIRLSVERADDQAQFRNETARSGIFANIAVDQAQKTPLSIVHDSGVGIVKLLVLRMVGMCPQQ